MRKAVLDTNVLVSAFLFEHGPARRLLERARAGAFVICLAEEILTQARRVLNYPRIRKKNKFPDEAIEAYLSLLRITSEMVSPLPDLHGIVRDPNDDMIVACAMGAQAQYVVTRDKDLLDLDRYKQVEMVIPEQYLVLLQ